MIESFYVAFFKKRPQSGHAECPSPSAEGETPHAFASATKGWICAKRKEGKRTSGGFPLLNVSLTKSFAAFLLREVGANKKLPRFARSLTKENAAFARSPRAPQAFEKAWPKLSNIAPQLPYKHQFVFPILFPIITMEILKNICYNGGIRQNIQSK